MISGPNGRFAPWLFLAALLALPPAAEAQSVAGAGSPQRALLDQYCVTCHNTRLKTGDLVLEGLDPDRPGQQADVWEKVLRKVSGGLMPPAQSRRPGAAAIKAFVARMSASIDADAVKTPEPGRPAIHRLNRAEYANAVRDILALDIDSSALLPADDAGFGFDNIADALSVSPGHMERYVAAAERVAALAVGDPSIGNETHTYALPYITLLQEDRMNDDLPAGSRGGLAVRHHFPLDGEYLIRVKLQGDPQFSVIRGMEIAQQVDLRLDGVRVKAFAMEPKRLTQSEGAVADSHLQLRVPVKAGTRLLSAALVKDTWYMESMGPERLPGASFGLSSGTRSDPSRGKQLMGIDSVKIEGPFNGTRPADTPSRRNIFVCQPSRADDTPCAKKILGRLARRAFRRPETAADVSTLMKHFGAGRAHGDFDAGIQRALEAVLVDPEFLFRAEYTPAGVKAGQVHRISDLELASRLSFFLWSSVPDDELLEAATSGTLRSPATVEAQVRRMLADPRSNALVRNFFGQWLWLRNVATAGRDTKEFPEFDDSLRAAFERETDLFLESQIRDDRPALELLTANYTFVNEKLARHYGIPYIYGSHFRRVTLPDDRRAGLLGQGAILTITSYPNRTSPVVRGKWLLENILGVPPPPPPPDVPPFPESDGTGPPRSVRARMEQHRRNPVCATCHAQLDPLGFALENFNAVGQWRTEDAGGPVDASGALPDGQTFNGPAEFRAALMTRQDAFVTHLASKLLTYALGRGTEHYDMPAVRGIIRTSAPAGYRWSSLVLGIVNSVPFQMRKAPTS